MACKPKLQHLSSVRLLRPWTFPESKRQKAPICSMFSLCGSNVSCSSTVRQRPVICVRLTDVTTHTICYLSSAIVRAAVILYVLSQPVVCVYVHQKYISRVCIIAGTQKCTYIEVHIRSDESGERRATPWIGHRFLTGLIQKSAFLILYYICFLLFLTTY